jgi:hypothetical protein
VLAAIFGPENAATKRHTHFRTWHKRRLREIEVEYGDRLDEVAEFLAEFASKIKTLGPAGYPRATSHTAPTNPSTSTRRTEHGKWPAASTLPRSASTNPP